MSRTEVFTESRPQWRSPFKDESGGKQDEDGKNVAVESEHDTVHSVHRGHFGDDIGASCQRLRHQQRWVHCPQAGTPAGLGLWPHRPRSIAPLNPCALGQAKKRSRPTVDWWVHSTLPLLLTLGRSEPAIPSSLSARGILQRLLAGRSPPPPRHRSGAHPRGRCGAQTSESLGDGILMPFSNHPVRRPCERAKVLVRQARLQLNWGSLCAKAPPNFTMPPVTPCHLPSLSFIIGFSLSSVCTVNCVSTYWTMLCG